MVTLLPRGKYWGKCQHVCQTDDIVVTETRYDSGVSIPRHGHERAYFCLVRRGGYHETFGTRSRECAPLTFAYHPAGEIHAQRMQAQRVDSFNIEVSPTWVDRVSDITRVLREPFAVTGGPLSRLAQRIYSASRRHDPCFGLIVEGLMLQIVAEAAGEKSRSPGRSCKSWLDRVHERLTVEFEHPPTLAEIATDAGVHPAYAATAFRHRYGCTMGEFVRRRRVDAAIQALVTSPISLAQIGLQVGFADQSHFTREFKRATGFTPAAYRRLFGPGSIDEV